MLCLMTSDSARPTNPVPPTIATTGGPGSVRYPARVPAKEAGSSSPPLPMYTRVGVLLQGPLVG
jgi:hypothetical protein